MDIPGQRKKSVHIVNHDQGALLSSGPVPGACVGDFALKTAPVFFDNCSISVKPVCSNIALTQAALGNQKQVGSF
jgi:hypothetical protein